MPETRVAKPGDLCVLLLPDDAERLILRRKQEELNAVYGGWLVPEPHITCQRFRLGSAPNYHAVSEAMRAALSALPPFTVYAASITEFLSPFWGTYVIRWRVQEDEGFQAFLKTIDQTLLASGCEIHYEHDFPPTCSAVEVSRPIRLDIPAQFSFPQALFMGHRVMVTGILGMDEFETLGEYSLSGSVVRP